MRYLVGLKNGIDYEHIIVFSPIEVGTTVEWGRDGETKEWQVIYCTLLD